MKTYIVVTGSLFGILALAHVWRIVAEWPLVTHDPWAVVDAGIGVLAGALALWAWRLVRRREAGG